MIPSKGRRGFTIKTLIPASLLLMAAATAMVTPQPARSQSRGACDKACLERIGDQYRAAYVKRQPSALQVSRRVRFTENNVELKFPDGSWDAVTQEVGPALTFSDPKTGGVGIYTAVMMNDTPAFLTVRLKVERGQITEIEHLLSTKRGVSGPPTPFGDVTKLVHDPEMNARLQPGERNSREEMIRLGDGYFQTLARNDGRLYTNFSPKCHRIENGMETAADGCATGFKLGRFRFNERVRRQLLLVDEERGLVMFRGFIDHKGVMDRYTLTDGREVRSIFREPHTWSFIETFKIKDGQLGPVEANFIGDTYCTPSPWTPTPIPPLMRC